MRVCIIATTAPGGHVLRRSDLSTAQLLAHMVKLRHVDSIIQEGHQPTIRYSVMTVIVIVYHAWSNQVLLEPPLIVGPIEHSSSIQTVVLSSRGDGVGCVLSTVTTAAHSRYLYYHPTELVTQHSIAAAQHLLHHITAILMVCIMMLLT